VFPIEKMNNFAALYNNQSDEFTEFYGDTFTGNIPLTKKKENTG
jgi:hypothetical protein